MDSKDMFNKNNLISFLEKREEISEFEVNYMSVPYSINPFECGAEEFLNKFISFSTNNYIHICFSKNRSGTIKIYNYNEPELVELYLDGKGTNAGGFGLICQQAIKVVRNDFKCGFNCVIKDDLYPAENYSIALKLSSVLFALFKSNNIELDNELLLKILGQTQERLLNFEINILDLITFVKNIPEQNISVSEKLNWSELGNYKLLQIFSGKRQIEDFEDFKAEIEKASNLVKVLLASKKLPDITFIDKHELEIFLRRLPQDQQRPILFLYEKSMSVNKSTAFLKSNKLDMFFNEINISNEYIPYFDESTGKIWNRLKYIKEIRTKNYCIQDGNILCIFRKENEDKILYEMEKISEDINFNICGIEGIFTSERD